MKPFILFACFVLLSATALVVRADIAKPKPAPSAEAKLIYSGLQIIPEPNGKGATLRIPQSTMNELVAAYNGQAPNTTIAASITNSRPRTIIAGILLCLSVSFAGVWLARASRSKSTLGRSQKAVAIVLIAVATIGAAAIITRGNAGPPPSWAWRNLPNALTEGQSIIGPITIMIVPNDPNEGNNVKLTIPTKKKKANGEEE